MTFSKEYNILYNMKKIIQFSTIILTEIIFAILGVLFGLDIYGKFGSFKFAGHVGYESIGNFFGIIGIVIGALFWIIMYRFFKKEKVQYISLLTISILLTVIELILFNYTLSLIIVLLLPAILTSFYINRKVF